MCRPEHQIRHITQRMQRTLTQRHPHSRHRHAYTQAKHNTTLTWPPQSLVPPNGRADAVRCERSCCLRRSDVTSKISFATQTVISRNRVCSSCSIAPLAPIRDPTCPRGPSVIFDRQSSRPINCIRLIMFQSRAQDNKIGRETWTLGEKRARGECDMAYAQNSRQEGRVTRHYTITRMEQGHNSVSMSIQRRGNVNSRGTPGRTTNHDIQGTTAIHLEGTARDGQSSNQTDREEIRQTRVGQGLVGGRYTSETLVS